MGTLSLTEIIVLFLCVIGAASLLAMAAIVRATRRRAPPPTGAELDQLKQRMDALEKRLEFHDRWLSQQGGHAPPG